MIPIRPINLHSRKLLRSATSSGPYALCVFRKEIAASENSTLGYRLWHQSAQPLKRVAATRLLRRLLAQQVSLNPISRMRNRLPSKELLSSARGSFSWTLQQTRKRHAAGHQSLPLSVQPLKKDAPPELSRRLSAQRGL